MKIKELFEASSNPQPTGVVPGDKISEVPPGARPTGDYPTPITQGPPQTSNTPKTVSPTGFTPSSKNPDPGSSETTNTTTNPAQPQTPEQPDTDPTSDNLTKELQSLKMMVRQMQGQLTPPPPPPN